MVRWPRSQATPPPKEWTGNEANGAPVIGALHSKRLTEASLSIPRFQKPILHTTYSNSKSP